MEYIVILWVLFVWFVIECGDGEEWDLVICEVLDSKFGFYEKLRRVEWF